MPPSEIIVSLPFPNLKASLERSKEFGEEVAREFFRAQFESWQEIVLWNIGGVACSKCGVIGDLHPRGWQPRKLKSGFGGLEFRLRRATCDACGVTSSPVPGLIGLRPRQRMAPDIEDMAAEWVGKLPYAALSALLGHQVTPRTLRRAVLRMAEEQEAQGGAALPEGGWVLLVDQTAVPIGPTHRGSHMTLCLAVTNRKKGKRPRLHVEVILLDTQMPLPVALETVAILVKDTPPSLILHDGDPTLAETLKRLFPDIPKQRCVWHLERGLGFALWQDGLPKDARQPFQDELREALYSPSLPQGERTYERLVRDLRGQGLSHAAGFLAEAQSDAFTFRTQVPGLSRAIRFLTAQSPIERQMREVNRRADVGCRWSPQGLHAVLFLAITHRLRTHNLPFLETEDAA